MRPTRAPATIEHRGAALVRARSKPLARPPATSMTAFVNSYGMPNAERVLPTYEQYASSAFAGNAVVFGLIRKRLMMLSQARFKWRRLSDKRLFGDQGLAILEKPWLNGSTADLFARMEIDVSLAGNSFIRDAEDELEPLRPDWVTIVSEVREGTRGKQIRQLLGYWFDPIGDPDREAEFFLPDEVAHWAPIPDPLARWRGMSWITPVLREINADLAMTSHRDQYYRNAATPNIVLKYQQKLGTEQILKIRDFVNARHGGPDNAGSTMVLDQGADLTPVGALLSGDNFSEVQAAGENRIAVASGVPAAIAGLKEGMQGSALNAGNYDSSMRQWVDTEMRPAWESACAALSVLVTVPADAQLWFDTADISALQPGELDSANTMQVQSMTANTLITAGYEPESVKNAIIAGDLTLLQHTGLVSVQLLPPGQQDQAATGAPTDGAPADVFTQRSYQMDIFDELAEVLRGDFNPDLHPRGRGGKFRTVGARITAALDNDPRGSALTDQFSPKQLRDTAKKAGLNISADTSIDDVVKALVAHHKAARKDRFTSEASALYDKGQSLSQVADALGVSTSKVHDALTKAGVELRPRGGVKKVADPAAERKNRLNKAVQLYDSGKSLREIADQLGVASSTVHDMLTKAGHELRPRGGKTATRADLHPGDNGDNLKNYWTHGEGLARWIDSPHKFEALRDGILSEANDHGNVMTEEKANRIAAQWYHDTLGYWPGDKQHGHHAHRSAVDWDDFADLTDEPDDDVDLLVDVFDELSQVQRADWNPDLHPRGKDGRFRNILGRVVGALNDSNNGDNRNPLEDFNREQLRQVAKTQGVSLPKGASHQQIVDALLADLHAAPKPSRFAELTAQFPQAHQGFYFDSLKREAGLAQRLDTLAARGASDAAFRHTLDGAERQFGKPTAIGVHGADLQQSRDLIDAKAADFDRRLAEARRSYDAGASQTQVADAMIADMLASGDWAHITRAESQLPPNQGPIHLQYTMLDQPNGPIGGYRVSEGAYVAAVDGNPEAVLKGVAEHIPAEAVTPTAKPDVVSQLRQAASRADAEQMLKAHTKPQLQDVARDLGVPFTQRATKPTLTSAILDEVGHGDTADVLNAPLTDQIESAYSDLAAGRDVKWVSLTELRPQLGGTKAEQDAALLDLLKQRRIILVGEANQKALEPEDRAAAIHVGGFDKHLIMVKAPDAPSGLSDAELLGGKPSPSARATAYATNGDEFRRAVPSAKTKAELKAANALADRLDQIAELLLATRK